jgi:hypothetical protein
MGPSEHEGRFSKIGAPILKALATILQTCHSIKFGPPIT